MNDIVKMIYNENNSFGGISVNDARKLANGNGSGDIISSLTSPILANPRTKFLKIHVIHLIRFCLKSGITKNKEIIRFLKENKVVLKSRTFDRYKSIAEKELENDLGADIWLSGKVQNGLVQDYKDISDRYDKQLVLDDILMESLIRQAIDKAVQYDNDPEKYYRHLDMNEMMKIQAVSNYTMKNKLELISKGFMVYKIKQHIEYLREQINQKENKKESKELDLSSFSFLPKANSDYSVGDSPNNTNEPQSEEYDRDYLDRNGLAIGMNGQPIAKYLADIEKKLGKPLSTL